MSGSNEAALGWPALLGFGAILLAAMQGALGMESVQMCRISRRKVVLLLFLEFVQMIIVFASEIVSFVQLRTALQPSLRWLLHWLPPCILAIGVLELFGDLWFTLVVASYSRIYWTPFAACGGRKENEWRSTSFVVVLSTIITSFSLSLVLVFWRQRWIWSGVADSPPQLAIDAAEHAQALSPWALGFSVGWGLFATVTLTASIIAHEWRIFSSGQSIFRLLRHVWHPDKWVRVDPSRQVILRPHHDDTYVLEAQYRLLLTLKSSDPTCPVFDDEFQPHLKESPLHYGNAIVGVDRLNVINRDNGALHGVHSFFLFAEHLTVLPLLICVVAAVAQIHDRLSPATFLALKEMSSMVIIVSFQEVAVGLKKFMWGYQGKLDKDEDEDEDSLQAKPEIWDGIVGYGLNKAKSSVPQWLQTWRSRQTNSPTI